MKSEKEKLGRRIKEIRRARGLSQEQLAELIGIEQKHVSRLEVGKSYPTIDRLEKIALALNVSMGSFFDSENQTSFGEKSKRLEQMLSELDNDYQLMILKFSQIMKALHETITPR